MSFCRNPECSRQVTFSSERATGLCVEHMSVDVTNAQLQVQLSAMTAARDEACDRLEAAWNRLYLKSEMAEVGDGGVASLRSVGRAK